MQKVAPSFALDYSLSQMEPIRLHISICALRSNKDGWGDTEYALALKSAVLNHGHEAELFFSGEHPKIRGPRDVVLRIIGPHIDDTVPGVPNLLWMISMPNYQSFRILARYQTIITSSALLTQRYQQSGLPACYLAQATDPDQFHPDKRGPDAEILPLVFVGNYGVRAPRTLIKAVAQLSQFDLAVWGEGWNGQIPDHCIRATRLPYKELPALYARSRIILNSHMPHMARLGIMSNRSYDALAAGAAVLSDHVNGYSAPDLPDLHQISHISKLEGFLETALSAPPDDWETRLSRNAHIRAGYSFSQRASELLALADKILTKDQRVPQLFVTQPPSSSHSTTGNADPTWIELVDDTHPGSPSQSAHDIEKLDEALEKGPVHLTFRLSDPASMPGCESIAMAMLRSALAIQRILAVLARRLRLSSLELVEQEGSGQTVIHPMMAALRQAQSLIRNPSPTRIDQETTELALRAQRIVDLLLNTRPDGSILQNYNLSDADLISIMKNHPLYRRYGANLDWNQRKTHIALWPRRSPVSMDRPIGVFIHLFYPQLASPIGERMSRINADKKLYISTDNDHKASMIAQVMPEAEIRVFPNTGRDIAPKLYGFHDVYQNHDLVLHLHGKRSSYTHRLNEWFKHILDCLLPDTDEINRILSFFKDIKTIGIVAPQVYRPVLRSMNWARNFELAEELRYRLDWAEPLPDDEDLYFPAGSMFWARTAALKPLLDLSLKTENFPPETGQIDGTITHAIERMFGACCQHTGHSMICVAPSANTEYSGQKITLKSNSALRAWLEDRSLEPAELNPTK